MQTLLNATEVRANFGGFIDSVIREKPQLVKRNRDIIVTFSLQHIKDILSAYKLTFEYEQDEDGKFAGSIEQIEDIVAEGDTLEDLRYELARQLVEYAQDYYSNFSRYHNAPNRQHHAFYVFRVLLEDDIEKVANLIHA